MVSRDNIHSRLVFWLKITLPLLALALLSTLFLFSRHIETDGALPYAEVDVEDLARDPRLTAPEYSAMTEDGAALQISAAEARPNAATADNAAASTVVAAYDTPGGLRIDLSAAAGQIDQAGGRLLLSGGVKIATSQGYVVTTEALDGALSRTDLHSDGALTATAPYGRIDAGGMEIRHGDANMADYLLVFDKGVKLVYEPGRKGH